jgi:hypothetical protein
MQRIVQKTQNSSRFCICEQQMRGREKGPEGAVSGIPGGRRFETKVALAASYKPHVSTLVEGRGRQNNR